MTSTHPPGQVESCGLAPGRPTPTLLSRRRGEALLLPSGNRHQADGLRLSLRSASSSQSTWRECEGSGQTPHLAVQVSARVHHPHGGGELTPVVPLQTKCHQYWPDPPDVMEHGHFHIRCVSEDCTLAYVFREMLVTNTEVSRAPAGRRGGQSLEACAKAAPSGPG